MKKAIRAILKKQQTIDFAKKHQAVTYLVLSLKDAELLGVYKLKKKVMSKFVLTKLPENGGIIS